MSICIKTYGRHLRHWLGTHPNIQQWLWFIALWCGGLLTVLAIAYPIKWLIKSMG